MNLIHLPPGRYRVYLRISQDQSGREVGVDRQWEDLQPTIKGNPGVVIVGEPYRDPDVSATKEHVVRPEFERLLKELLPGEHILCWHSDRFIRTTRDLMRVIKTGALVHALFSGYFDLSTPAGVAVAKTQIAWSEYEGQQKSLRQKSSHQQRARGGRPFLGGQRPFGFVKTEDSYEHHASEASALRKVYDMVIDGATVTACAEYLNSLNLTTNRGLPWNYNALRQILVKPRYAGILTYNGEEMGMGNWEPIVSEQVFRAAHRILTDPARRTSGPRMGRGGILHYLVGVAICGVCGGPTRQMKIGGSTYSTYQCRNGHASARSDWLERRAAALLIELCRPALAAREITTPDVSALRDELRDLHLEVKQYEAAHKAKKLTLPQFLDFNETAQQRIGELDETLANVTLGTMLGELASSKDPRALWTSRTVRQQADIARTFYERIEILPRRRGPAKQLEGVGFAHIKGFPEPIAL